MHKQTTLIITHCKTGTFHECSNGTSKYFICFLTNILLRSEGFTEQLFQSSEPILYIHQTRLYQSLVLIYTHKTSLYQSLVVIYTQKTSLNQSYILSLYIQQTSLYQFYIPSLYIHQTSLYQSYIPSLYINQTSLNQYSVLSLQSPYTKQVKRKYQRFSERTIQVQNQKRVSEL